MQSRMLSRPPNNITERSIPSAMPPCGGAQYCSASSKKPNRSLACWWSCRAGRRPAAASGVVNTDRAAARFIAVDDQIVSLSTARPGSVQGRDVLVRGDVNGWCIAPSQLFLVIREHRKLDDPGEVHLLGSTASVPRPAVSAIRSALHVTQRSATNSSKSPGSARIR